MGGGAGLNQCGRASIINHFSMGSAPFDSPFTTPTRVSEGAFTGGSRLADCLRCGKMNVRASDPRLDRWSF